MEDKDKATRSSLRTLLHSIENKLNIIKKKDWQQKSYISGKNIPQDGTEIHVCEIQRQLHELGKKSFSFKTTIHIKEKKKKEQDGLFSQSPFYLHLQQSSSDGTLFALSNHTRVLSTQSLLIESAHNQLIHSTQSPKN